MSNQTNKLESFFDGQLLKITLALIVFLTPLSLAGIAKVNSIENDVNLLKNRTDMIERVLEKRLTEIDRKLDLATEEIIKLRIKLKD
jgi:hypothetical protein